MTPFFNKSVTNKYLLKYYGIYMPIMPSVIFLFVAFVKVDLMHRCLYSILHPEDMFDLKVILETTLGHLVTIHDQSETHQVCMVPSISF